MWLPLVFAQLLIINFALLLYSAYALPPLVVGLWTQWRREREHRRMREVQQILEDAGLIRFETRAPRRQRPVKVEARNDVIDVDAL
jgi:hypothetical protein